MKALENIASKRLDDKFLYPSDTIYSGLLTSGVEQTLTIPTDAEFCIFEYTGDVYVNYDTTASVPTSTISSGGGELNPTRRYIGETTTLHFASNSAVTITISFFKK
jgi:hypothetical protein